MALVNDQRWSSVIWIGAGFVASILTFWYPVVIRQQWDSHRALVQSAWFSFLPALESRRPLVTFDKKTYEPTLLPAHILLLRWLGQFSQVVPGVVFVLFVLSFWQERMARVGVVCSVAICQCAFTTLYALYATGLLGLEWLQSTA